MVLHLPELIWLVIAAMGFACAALNALFARADNKSNRKSPVPSDRFFFRIVYVSARLTLFIGASMPLVAAFFAVFGIDWPARVICWTIVSLYFAIHQSLGLFWRRKLNLGDYGGKTYQEIDRRHHGPTDGNAGA